MKKLTTAAVALAASTSIAAAGGLDRSGQSVGIIFEDGNYAQLSFGNVNPSVSGSYTPANTPSGDMAPSYNQIGGGIKFEVSPQLSLALLFDQPWGASAAYPTPAFAATQGLTAELNSRGITGIAKYQINRNVSVFGGIRQNTVDMSIQIPAIGVAPGYSATGAASSAMGYVLGAAYEIPDIALRVALTYSSETTHDIATAETVNVGLGATTTNSTTRVTMPKSFNLDFQTGIAADTLLTAGVRYVNWSATSITPLVYSSPPINQGSIVAYTEDSYTFSLGVGRRFSDSLAGSVTLGWERPQGGVSQNLSPVDGNVSLTVGGSYTMDNLNISGGVRYVKLGDATTNAGGQTGTFTNNSAIGLGMTVGFNF